jgi:ubiquinone/menaquinone biosynthesis C-methylase UbiE
MSMKERADYLATGFRDVDQEPDLEKLSACLRFLDALPSFGAYKARSLEKLQVRPGDTVVDLGCGLGLDVRRLAGLVSPGGMAVGIDESQKLLNLARRAFPQDPSMRFEQGDIHRLPFANASVDAVRIDRTLQHVARPVEVIAEMTRVLKPGGRMVCAEPDWFSFVIDSDDQATMAPVVERWRHSFRNPSIGRQLLRRIREQGLDDTWMEGYILLADGLEAVDRVYDLRKTVSLLAAEGGDKGRPLEAWLENLAARDKDTAVTASVTLFLAGGRKPLDGLNAK